MVHFYHLPSTTQSLVHFYHGDLLIADGVAQTNLGIEIATLCIEHIKITYYTVDVLQLSQLHGGFRRAFQLAARFVDFLYLIELYNGVTGILKGAEYRFFVTVASLLVGCFLRFQHGAVLAHSEKRT